MPDNDETNAEQTLANPMTFRSPVQEHHIDFLLEEEFAVNPAFLSYFLGRAQENFAISVNRVLPAGMLTPSSAWQCNAVRSATTNAGETDVLVLYQCDQAASGKVAILIEDKIRASFQTDQAARYRTRGDAGIESGFWNHFFTCLVAPEKYSKDLAGFDTRVTLESIFKFFDSHSHADERTRFKAAVVNRALKNFAAAAVQNVDPVMTSFRAFYAAEAANFFKSTEVQWDGPREAWYDDSWFNFRHPRLGTKTKIIHKTKKGAVELILLKSVADGISSSVLEIPMNVQYRREKTDGHATFSIAVTKINDFADSSNALPILQQVFSAVNELVSLGCSLI